MADIAHFDVLLITGSAGTGKTTTAEAWAASRQGRYAHLSHDHVMGFIKSGLVSPAEETSAEAERQWRLGLTICCHTALLYAKEGIGCAIDTFLLPHYLSLWQGLSQLRVGLVVLHPPVEIALERNRLRMQESGWGVADWQIYENHAAMSAWQGHAGVLVLDNAALSIAQVVAALDMWQNSATNVMVWR